MNMSRRDALARDINLEDITSSKKNAEVLRKLRDNDQNWVDNALYIFEANEAEEAEDDDDDHEEMVFSIREGDDLGWLGYFIGRNQSLDDLAIHFLPQERERVDAFIEGRQQQSQVHTFAPFEIGRECARELAVALSQRQVKSFRSLGFSNNNLVDEGFADIVRALWTQPQLEQLLCSSNNIGRISCEALGALMIGRISKLTNLYLPNSGIDDACLQALVPGLCNNNHLGQLFISDPITAVGLRSLSPFLQSDRCSLRYLNVSLRLGDEEAAALAGVLKGNKSLETLGLPHHHRNRNQRRNMTVTDAGINNTYLSNHNLTHIGAPSNYMDDTPTHVTDLLEMNAAALSSNRRNREIAFMHSLKRCKIFMSHPDLDMEPMFVYKLKCLPLVVEWFRRSIQLCGNEVGRWKESFSELQSRELSAVYKFVRGMPLQVSDGYWMNVLNESQAKKKMLQVEKRKFEVMLQRAEKGIQRAEKNERRASKRLRH
eukprot:scaffold13937_cov146-Skeletonema_marinoi.AAC.7